MSEKERGGLKRPGRPINNKSFSGKCDVRLTAEENSMLERLSEDNGATRSDIMRRALKNYFKYLTDEE